MGTILYAGCAGLYGVLGRIFKLIAITITLSLASVAAMAEPTVIAALGDSLTQGFGLPQEDGFVPRLQAWLRAEGEDVQILNAGVSGDTTAGGLSRIDWTLTPDVQALIVNLGGNDFLRGIDPDVSRANIAGILAVARKRGLPVLLVGLPAPGNFGPAYKENAQAMFPELAVEYDVLLYANFFAPLIDTATKYPATKFMQSDGIHPNADGVLKIVQAIGPDVQALVARVK
jgi:acyl-CoA thioesterase I